MIQKTIVALLTTLVIFLSLASAASDNGFSITVIGAGELSTNRISGNPGATVNFTVQFNNSNSSFAGQELNLTLSGVSITGMNKTVNGNESFQVSFVIPSTQVTQSRTLNVDVYSDGTLIGSPSDTVYYTVNGASTEIRGCTDSDASNYNSSATVDDGSCVYDFDNFCEFGEKGDLEFVDFNIDNLGIGDDEEWNPLDEIVIELEVENTDRDENVDDVIVELVILDENGDDVTRDFDLEDEEIDVGRIGDDESEIVTFRIDQIPADLEEGKYRLYFKAYSEDEEDEQCVDSSNDFNEDEYHEIEIVREEDPAVVIRSEVFGTNAVCGEQTPITVQVYNLGSDEEDTVLVTFENSELGIYQTEVLDNLRSGKMKDVTFNIIIPRTATKNSYDFRINTYFDYDDGDETDPASYDEDSDSIGERFVMKIDVLNCQIPTPGITAQLDSDAKQGEELAITATITNRGTQSKTFVISATGYDSWATLESVTPQTLTLAGGESKSTTIRMMPEESGVRSFAIEASTDGETFTQAISVNIEEKQATLFGGLDSVTLYLLIGIGVLVVLIVIILIIRIARRTSD